MLVKCTQCGYENDPQHHFCGMCGEPLRAPYAAPPQPIKPLPGITTPPPPSRPVPGISGPSVLGLGTEGPSRNVDYLLEDEDEPRSGSHLLTYVLLLILVGVAAIAAWRWREGGYPWEVGLRQHPAVTPAANSATPPAPPAQSGGGNAAAVPPIANQPVVSPATSPSASVPAPGPAAAPTPASAGEAHPAAAPANPESTSPVSTPAPSPAPDQAPEQTKPAEPKAAAPVAQSKPAPSGKPVVARKSVTPPTESADNSGDDANEDNPTAEVTPPRKAPKPAPREVPVAAPVDPTEAWVADGRKYLYGNGVPENCARAKAQMLAAAARSNVEAQSTLGTMYATGHCVDRDVISAYRWFAQALHNDPSNTRIQQDLEVLWDQMTPQERQAAVQRAGR